MKLTKSCSKLIIESLNQRARTPVRYIQAFNLDLLTLNIVNLLLTLNKFTPFPSVFIVGIEQVNIS